ncbi:LGFP repeat-containing protein [Rhodococcoides corynebacterioides]|nr:hypothetical protein [Rhodococcus corynebacterioides]
MIAVLMATGGGLVATAQPSTTPAAPTSSAPPALQQQAPAPADPCATTTAPTTTTTTVAPSTTTPATPTSCTEAPTLAPSTSQAPTTASEAPSAADTPAPAPSSTTPATTSLTPSTEATAPTPTGERIPYTGLPTENPNSTLVPGKMRSDREEWPEGYTKEQADEAEIGEARLLAKQRTSRAAVTCQRYWPAPHDVCGAIRDKYNSLGGTFSFLLLPTSGNIINPGNTGERVTFMNGPIYWSAAGGAHPVVNSFLNRWGILGYEGSYLKYPTTDEIVLPDGGRRQEFQDGAIYVAFQNAIGSAIQNGPLRDKYNSVGGLTPGSSFLGYLTGDHIRTLPDGLGQMARFQNGVIYWHPVHGAHSITGLQLAMWQFRGYENGHYGYPQDDGQIIDGKPTQLFHKQQMMIFETFEVDAAGGNGGGPVPGTTRTSFTFQQGGTTSRSAFDPLMRVDGQVNFWADGNPFAWGIKYTEETYQHGIAGGATPTTCDGELYRDGVKTGTVYHKKSELGALDYPFHSHVDNNPKNDKWNRLKLMCWWYRTSHQTVETITYLDFRLLSQDYPTPQGRIAERSE